MRRLTSNLFAFLFSLAILSDSALAVVKLERTLRIERAPPIPGVYISFPLSGIVVSISNGDFMDNDKKMNRSTIAETGVAIRMNKSIITAEVINVDKLESCRPKLTLKILESIDVRGFPNFVHCGDTLDVYILFYKDTEGEINLTNPQNIENLFIFNLQSEEVICAEVSLRGPGMEGGVWYAKNLSRCSADVEKKKCKM